MLEEYLRSSSDWGKYWEICSLITVSGFITNCDSAAHLLLTRFSGLTAHHEYFITPASCTGLTWCWTPVCLRNKHSAEGPELENLTFPFWLIVLFQLTCANRKDEQRPKAHSNRSPSPWLSVWEGLIFKVRGCSIGVGLLQRMCLCVCCPSWSQQHLH